MRWAAIKFAEEIATSRGLLDNQVVSALLPRLHSVLGLGSRMTPALGENRSIQPISFSTPGRWLQEVDAYGPNEACEHRSNLASWRYHMGFSSRPWIVVFLRGFVPSLEPREKVKHVNAGTVGTWYRQHGQHL